MVEGNSLNYQTFNILFHTMHSLLNIIIRNVALVHFMALLLINSKCNSATLQFSSSEDRPLALYRAPAPYQETGKARLNSVIITSRPFSVGEQLNSTGDTVTPESFWRRQLFVSSSTTTPRTHDSTQIPHISIDCSNGKSCSETFTVDSTSVPTFKSYSKDVLHKFLSDYAISKSQFSKMSNDVTPPTVLKTNSSTINSKFKELSDPLDASNRLTNIYLDDEEEEDTDLVSVDAKSRPHWSLINAQQHNHPYDDRDGWVTLEAVPWSSSKISKWQSHNTGNKRPQWTTIQKPSNLWGNRPLGQNWGSETPDKPLDRPHYTERPYDRPVKPQYLIGNHPIDYSQPNTTHMPVLYLDQPVSDHSYKPLSTQQWITSSHPDIITDQGTEHWPIPVNHPVGAGNFKPWPIQSESDNIYQGQHPDDIYKYESNRRPIPTPVVYHDEQIQTQHPYNHPDNSDGEWILLSSTKGYSLPVRHHSYQRGLTLNPKPITSTKTVKLTVLPAVNGTSNTTTSHGGLLEVESTFQTVDEAKKYEELKAIMNSANQTNLVKADYSKMPVRLISNPVKQKGSGRAVLAAVGAGMLPATMALLVPMMLGRRKRSTSLNFENLMVKIPTQIPINYDTHTRKDNKLKWNLSK